MNFETLGLNAPICAALAACGYEEPTPIQEQAIPAALAGRDVLGCAQTGTGKTCAFGAPILQRLSKATRRERPVRALILTPTRELAIQIGESFVDYGKNLRLRSTVIFGGVGQNPQTRALQRGVDILTATPGRLLDLHGQGLLDLSQVEILVLDEADRMLDMGFIHDVRRILKTLPEKKQTLFFSATMPPEVTELVNSLLTDPVRVAVDPVSSPVELIRQEAFFVDRGNKTALLAWLLKEESAKSALVFTRTKHGADKVARELDRAGVTAAAIHGNKSQTARQQALADFKSGKLTVLVATDIAARGLDIEELSHVVNYNLPEVPETYIHRIGRTGRAGHDGTAVSFCDYSELSMLRGVEHLLGHKIPKRETHPWPMVEREALKRDSKGRIINPEDAEARAAAHAAKKEQPNSKLSQSGRQRPMPNKFNMPRPDPLDGEVVLDATARLLASKPKHLTQSGNPAPPRPAHSGNHPANHKNHPPQKRTGVEAPTKRSTVDLPMKPKEKRPLTHEPPRPARPADTRAAAALRTGRKPTRRNIPQVEGLRSAQKDSTEQPSLMKPYYIEHD
ncbi:MAG: DEAD/DEAH box helicase [Evtepia sp.]